MAPIRSEACASAAHGRPPDEYGSRHGCSGSRTSGRDSRLSGNRSRHRAPTSHQVAATAADEVKRLLEGLEHWSTTYDTKGRRAAKSAPAGWEPPSRRSATVPTTTPVTCSEPGDAAEAEMAGRGVDRLGLPRRGAITQAVVRSAEVRSALDHLRRGLTNLRR